MYIGVIDVLVYQCDFDVVDREGLQSVDGGRGIKQYVGNGDDVVDEIEDNLYDVFCFVILDFYNFEKSVGLGNVEFVSDVEDCKENNYGRVFDFSQLQVFIECVVMMVIENDYNIVKGDERGV